MPDIQVIEVPGGVKVLEHARNPEVIVTQKETFVVLTMAKQGPPGAPGQPGQAGVSYLVFPAASALGGNRIVRLSAGELVYADKNDVGFANAPLGFTMSAVGPGANANVQTSGLMTEPSWSWTPDRPIFVGANGVPTQTAPTSGFSLVVGVATSSTQIFIGAKMPIILQE